MCLTRGDGPVSPPKTFSTARNPTLTEQISAPDPLPSEPEIVPVADKPPLDSTQSPELEITGPVPAEARYSMWQISLRIMALAAAVVITIGLYLIIGQEQIRRFQEYGYLGIFLISLIGNASIALPIPSLFFTFVGGSAFNWVIVGLVSGIGEALGESTGYLAGYGGSAIIENQTLYQRMQGWMKKYGGLTIFVLSVVPNPIIDLAGIAAGASGFGYFRFLFFCWAGKTIKTLAFAAAGAYSVNWLLDYLSAWIG